MKKQVTILRGIPGSGKTSFVIKETINEVICSADDFMVDAEGYYAFDPARLGECHAKCFRRFLEALAAGQEAIVDNTNTTYAEIAPYYLAAKAYGYSVSIVEFRESPEVGAERNSHGVPLAACKAMAERLKEPLPPFLEASIMRIW